MTFEPGAELDFRLEGSGVEFVGGSARGHELRLTLDGDGREASGVTYLGREGAGDWVINENGIGLLEFWNLPLAR